MRIDCVVFCGADTLSLYSGFVAFDTFKSMLQDQDGKISGPRTVIAGFGAGFTESLLAVTPFESIKTQLSVLSHIPVVLSMRMASSNYETGGS
jgi:hypothetical protein